MGVLSSIGNKCVFHQKANLAYFTDGVIGAKYQICYVPGSA